MILNCRNFNDFVYFNLGMGCLIFFIDCDSIFIEREFGVGVEGEVSGGFRGRERYSLFLKIKVRR